MTPNPFVSLWQDPVTTLAAIGYTLLLLGASVGVLGTGYRFSITLYNEWTNRRRGGNYDPKWEYVPPWRVIRQAVTVLFLGAVEAFLVAGVIFMVA